jgi:hypothetical protein
MIICQTVNSFRRQTRWSKSASSLQAKHKKSESIFFQKLEIFLPLIIPPSESFSLRSFGLLVLAMTPLVLAFLASLGTSFIGTLLEILGVYRSCLCQIPTRSWATDQKNHEWMDLATDTESARYASRFWTGCGVTSIVFMIVVTYFGWWYQKFLRKRFDTVVHNLLPPSSHHDG